MQITDPPGLKHEELKLSPIRSGDRSLRRKAIALIAASVVTGVHLLVHSFALLAQLLESIRTPEKVVALRATSPKSQSNIEAKFHDMFG